MEYRQLPHGGEQFSIIGLGLGSIHELPESEIEGVLFYAIEHGINFFDLCAGNLDVYRAFRRASAGRRSQLYTQMHFGAVYEQDDKYGLSRDLETIKRTFSRLLQIMDTDYTDMGFIHCVDEDKDFDEIMSNGVFDYLRQLKEQGAVKHIGFSSHTPSVARRFIETGLIDMFMFSINPAYDYAKGAYGYGAVDERTELYKLCEKNGIGISVMKAFCAGQLLDAQTSPLNIALTRNQCLRYALDRPAVLTCLPGVRSIADVKEALLYFDAAPEELDYSIISQATPQEDQGRCVYCNHCQPCPAGIDIGLVNKYYDLAMVGDELARSHYQKLSIKADACLECGHCETACPFRVQQMARMKAIQAFFG